MITATSSKSAVGTAAVANSISDSPEEVADAFTAESAFDLKAACTESRVWIEVCC